MKLSIKKINIIFFSMFLLFSCQLFLTAMENGSKKIVRGCCHWGFGAEFLWVINYLDWCLRSDRVPVIYWGPTFAYYSPQGFNGQTNAWEYYFEPVSELQYDENDTLDTQKFYMKDFCAIWHYVQYVDNLHLLPHDSGLTLIHVPGHNYATHAFDRERPGQGGMPVGKNQKHLYDKDFRHLVKISILDRFIKLKPSLSEKIDAFYRANFKGQKVVGIHLRGTFLHGEVIPVPTAIILKEAKKFESLGYKVFVATDQNPLLEEAKEIFKDNVLYYDIKRFDKTTSPLKPQQLDPQRGEDFLIELFLLL